MFLLDTHTLLWFIEDDIKLSIQAKSILSENSTPKLELNISLAEFFNLIHSSDINIINISTEHLLILNSIEHHHKDPFDRIIIAQAIAENFTIITKDENFSKYEVNIIW